MKIEDIARIAHEVNRAYCYALGDHSQPEWHKAPDWQQQSALHGAEHHVKKAAKGNIPDPAWSHTLWMKEKQAAGWKYGPVKDADLKEHPCMVPFEELPKEQQAKDYIFVTVCLQLAALRED